MFGLYLSQETEKSIWDFEIVNHDTKKCHVQFYNNKLRIGLLIYFPCQVHFH